MEFPAKKSYPRALPHRSPEDIVEEAEHQRRALQAQLAAESVRLQRSRRWLVGALAGVLVLAAAVVVVIILKWPGLLAGNKAPDAVVPTNADTAPKGAQAGSPPAESVAARETPTPAPAPKPPGEPAHAAQQGVFLEVLGGLSAAHLYQSYLTIGLLAEGVESKAYSLEEAKTTLKIVTNCMNLVDKKLAKVEAWSLDPDDQDSLQAHEDGERRASAAIPNAAGVLGQRPARARRAISAGAQGLLDCSQQGSGARSQVTDASRERERPG